MKNLLKVTLLVVAAALAVTLSSRADSSAPTTFGATNTVVANGTTTDNVGSGLDVTRWQNLALLCEFAGTTASTGNLVITIVRTLHDPDSSSAVWDTAGFTWTIAFNGTSQVNLVTNLPNDFVSAVGGLKIKSIQNTTSDSDASGFSLKLVGKNRSP